MNSCFELILVDQGAEACLYSLRMVGETETEFEKALAALAQNELCQEFESRVADHLERAGFSEFNLKREAPDSGKHVYAMWRKNIRMFGFMWNHELFIAGGGGLKTAQKLQQNPVHLAIACQLQRLEDEFAKRVEQGEITVHPNGLLSGDLRFEV